MKYDNIIEGEFLSRPNRFIAEVMIDGKKEIAHVKNTGRCRELLTKNAKIYLQQFHNTNRKTKYDLISVYKGKRLINMDSQAPNKIFGEWLMPQVDLLKPEYKYKNSRLDFYAEANGKKILVEVKGVTLEENGVVMFPDAPSERAIKHVKELTSAVDEGYIAVVAFIIQMNGVEYLTPNDQTHKEFGNCLRDAVLGGVNVIALDCDVTKDTIVAKKQVKIVL